MLCDYTCLYSTIVLVYMLLLFKGYGYHRDLHVLTHSFPTRRSSDLLAQIERAIVATKEQRVGAGGDRRFRRGEDAERHAADDDGRCHQRQEIGRAHV